MSESPTVDELGQQPFQPYDLCPLATLNQRVIIDLPGVDADWVGKRGKDLCSKPLLVELIQLRAAALGWAGVDQASLPRRLNDLLETPSAPSAPLAAQVADLYGRRLGYLLASIVLGTEGVTSPLVPWEAAYLAHWRNEVREIILGGGLASGRLGEHIRAAAADVLALCGLGDRRVSAAAHPAFLPLIGAARSAGAGPGQAAAVADFGGTWAKRGVASYDTQGALRRLRLLPPVAIEELTAAGTTPELAAAMCAILAETLAQVPPDVALAPRVVCSVAAYVRDGQPALVTGRNMGTYSWLHQLSNNVTGWFSERLGMPFELAHDGDAAARALAGRPQAVVVMLGTALGVGFVPPATDLVPMADDFHLEGLIP